MKGRWQILPLLLCTAAFADEPAGDAIPQEPHSAEFGRHLRRTMALLEASQRGGAAPIRVLFYGQSIVAQGRLQSTLLAELRRVYPNASFIPTSNAIGGYEAPALVRTMVHDVVAFRPDLIVFDDYGGETDGSFEKIIAYLRSRTTAEVLMWSPHVDNFNAATDAQRDATAEFRKRMAQKYGCEFADVRGVWKQYLEQSKAPRTALLTDVIHNNNAGCELIARVLARHFVRYTGDAPEEPAVRTIAMNEDATWQGAGLSISGEWKKSADGRGILLSPGATLELSFKGIRVDIVGPVDAPMGSATVTVDDHAPTRLADCWAISRPSPAPIGWFPAINRIEPAGTTLERENWTLHFHDVAPDGTSYKYRLTGSKTGADGEGDSSADFVSRSKRLRFAVADISIAKSAKYTRKPLPAEFDITWRTYPMALDVYARKPGDAKNGAAWQTLVNALPNATHRLKLKADDGLVAVEQIIIHQPAIEAGTK